jgi:hypothetical protein
LPSFILNTLLSQSGCPEPPVTRPKLPSAGYYWGKGKHGPRKLLGAGVVQLMEQRSTGHSNFEAKTARECIWTSHHAFQGWTCSQCEWNYPLPTLLNDPEARTAYDRLAASKFRDHKCADHLSRLSAADNDSFTSRIRKLVAQGFKPKDAVELFLQEVALEYRNQPQRLAQAKSEGEDFLRRLKAGLI